jgi:hypothetical protein
MYCGGWLPTLCKKILEEESGSRRVGIGIQNWSRERKMSLRISHGKI